MKCLICTTELPVDGDSKDVECPKCGSVLSDMIDWANGEDETVEYKYENTKNSRPD